MCLAELMVNHAERALTQSWVGSESDRIGFLIPRALCKATRFPEFPGYAHAGTRARSDFKFKTDVCIPRLFPLNPRVSLDIIVYMREFISLYARMRGYARTEKYTRH